MADEKQLKTVATVVYALQAIGLLLPVVCLGSSAS